MDLFEAGLNEIWDIHSCISSEDTFMNCMLRHDVFYGTLWLLFVIIIYSFVWSIIGNNCSKVDQIWSITPWLYAWLVCAHYFYSFGILHKRILLMSVLMTFWGVRLTYNFWRRGGYGNLISHEEDYRWPILKKKMHPILFLIFNFTFIASYQNFLLWLIATPTYIVYGSDPTVITTCDRVLTAVFFVLLGMETLADQEHYDFQQYKHSLSPEKRESHSSKSIREGFLQEGLWKYSRHPNYFAEQSIWVVIYLFSLVGADSSTTESGNDDNGDGISSYLFFQQRYVNWTGMGVILLITLFQGSIAFGESITASKYPKYSTYQKTVSQLIPWFNAAGKMDDTDTKKMK